MDIRPHPKLLVKKWIGLLLAGFWTAVLAGALHILLGFDDDLTAAEIGRVLWPIAGGVYGASAIVAIPLIILWVKNLAYRLEDDRLIAFKGIFAKVQKNVPYRAVTDIMVHRSLVDRWLGIGSIRVQTAGQSSSATGYEANLEGLIDWKDLEEEVRSRLHIARGEMDATTVSPSEPVADAHLHVLRDIRSELASIRELLSQERRPS